MHDLNDYVEQVIRNRDERLLFRWFDGKQVHGRSNHSFYEDIVKVAVFLQKRGYSGRNIGITGPNSYEWLCCFLGIIYSGNTAVAFPDDHTILTGLIEKTDVELVFVEEAPDDGNSFVPMKNIWAEETAAFSRPQQTKEPAVILFTSGTTGETKAVCLSHSNIMSMFSKAIEEHVGKDMRGMSWLMTLPFHHVSLIMLLYLIYLENEIDILTSPKYFFKSMELLNPIAVSVVPLFVEMICKRLENRMRPEAFSGSRLKLVGCGGAALPPRYVKTLMRNHILVAQIYGMTESVGLGAASVVPAEKCESVGRVLDSRSLHIEEGEIVLKGPFIMTGYYKDEEETARTVRNGCLYTGDMGYVDQEGYLFITGRKKNLIILTNGENISPEELERTLYGCAAVTETVVYEKDNKIHTEIYAADSGSREEIRNYILDYNRNIPTYKRIQNVVFRDKPFEKNAMGKILRRHGGNV